MSISYYDDLTFISAHEQNPCEAEIDRAFGSTIAINLLWRGRIHFALEGESPAVLEGPTAYWTHGDRRFLYGHVPGHSWHQLWAHAGGPRIQRMIEGGLVLTSPRPWSVPADPDAFLATFRRLIALVKTGHPHHQAERVQLFEQLFLQATRGGGERLPASPALGITALAERIATAPTDRYDFEREAKRIGLSYHHLRRLFVAHVGRAPQAYLLDCRMRWAAARLTTGAESVKSVAYAAGFTDPRAFARQFRRRTGVAPSTLLR